MEKAGIAQFIDKLMEGMSKGRPEGSDLANVLPKPETQEIGDGIIAWRWTLCDGSVTIESLLATRDDNQANMRKDEYTVNLKMPESNKGTYILNGEVAKNLGQAILSAYNWKDIWKLHAGDFLLEELSRPANDYLEVIDGGDYVEVVDSKAEPFDA